MSTEGTGASPDDQPDAAARKTGTPAAPDTGVGLGAGEPNTFEPEEGTAPGSGPASADAQVAPADGAEGARDVPDTPVDATEPS